MHDHQHLPRTGNPINVTVSILIVTYNSSSVLHPCLDSIATGTHVSHDVIIVDNDSLDGTPAFVRKHYPTVRLVENLRNEGFGKAMNQACREACGKYLLMLNPDTVVHPGAIDALIEFLENHPEAGICVPYCFQVTGALQRNHYLFVNPWRLWRSSVAAGIRQQSAPGSRTRPNAQVRSDTPQRVAAVSCGAAAMSTQLFRAVGGFDEHFFLYYEDIDLSLRVQCAGFNNYLVPQAAVTHYTGHSSLYGPHPLGNLAYRYVFESQYWYTRKHYGPLQMWVLRLGNGLAGFIIWGLGLRHTDPIAQAFRVSYGRTLMETPAQPGHR